MAIVDREFEALFLARFVPVRRTAFLLCGDWNRAEDLAQTAFTKLYAAGQRIRDSRATEAYLRRTLLRTFIDERRRGWNRELASAEIPEVPVGPVATEERVTVMAALARLPRRQRACVVLRYFDDLSVDQTAEALGCSPGTVKSNTSRALESLSRALGDQEQDLTRSGGS